jgi:hypothetical protein
MNLSIRHIQSAKTMRHLWTILISLRLAAALASSSTSERPIGSSGGRLRLRQVLVVHRHGDRTPITPMRDEEYWRTTLPDPAVLEGIARGTSLLRPPEGGSAVANAPHGAVGRGPFGQLTMMGLLQMVGLGERLRGQLAGEGRRLHHHRHDGGDGDDDGVGGTTGPLRLFTLEEPLHPSRVKVMSTDFPRTIQSAQALLAGLFPDRATGGGDGDGEGGDRAAPIVIDVRNTNAYFIPDPQPRQHAAQLALERHLSERPHLLEREGRLGDLARRVVDALEGHLGEGAGGVSFGIGEEKHGDDAEEEEEAAAAAGEDDDAVLRRPRPRLAWAQLCEVLVCLSSRGLLPPALTEEDVAVVSDHVAWRWFENLGHPVLAKSAMWKFASGLVEEMSRKANEDLVGPRGDAAGVGGTEVSPEAGQGCKEEPMLCIYSAHDSTLIGLLCVLGLEQPVEWPEYGSALKLELLREEEGGDACADGHADALLRRHWVRFSLNGQVLRCKCLSDERNEPASLVSLDQLKDLIHSEHELFDADYKSVDGSGLKYSWKNGLLSQH